MDSLTKPNRKLTLEEALAIREDRKTGMKWDDLRVKYGRSRAVLSEVLNGTSPIFKKAEGSRV